MNQRRDPVLRSGGWAVGLMLSPSDLAMHEAYLHPTDEMFNEWACSHHLSHFGPDACR